MNKTILFLTQHLPYPPFSGARRREYEIIKRISKQFNVHICCISKVYEEDIMFSQKLKLENVTFKIYKTERSINLSESCHNNCCIQVERNNVTKVKKYVKKIIKNKEVNLIHCEGFFMMNLLPRNCNIPIILEEQNIEYTLWEQKANLFDNKNNIYKKQAKLTKKAEIDAWKTSSSIITVTENDKKIINKYFPTKDVTVITNGIDHELDVFENDIPRNEIDRKCYNLLFIGNYDYKPNEDAAIYFSKEIYPLISNKLTNVHTYFVGNIGNSYINNLSMDSRIKVIGRVNNISYYLERCDLFICPLRYGGGIKTKLLEAIAYRKAIVTTMIGLQGFNNEKESPFMVANTAKSFSNAVLTLLSNKTERKSLEKKCYSFIEKWPSWNDVSELFANVYSSYLN